MKPGSSSLRIFASIVTGFAFAVASFGQGKVAITIDDVPNVHLLRQRNFETIFLHALDSLQIPVCIFINEGMVYRTPHVGENFRLLDEWVKREYVTLGTHTFAHSHYSEVGFDAFVRDIERGEAVTRELAAIYHKELGHFRSPFNDLGKDSAQHVQIGNYLKERGYVSTPFTVESMDYMFNALYEHHLGQGRRAEAEEVAREYIDITLEYFAWFDSIALAHYGRSIPQIYLCHENSLNADCFSRLAEELSAGGYAFVSLDEAMKDPVYLQEDTFWEKWGISWVYRWMTNREERLKLMRQEPEPTESYQLYEELSQRGAPGGE
ncbi:MAG: polysaccharide deacetylase family protein [Bacteroidales bacterium]